MAPGCNAKVTSGCGSTPPTVTTGANPQFVAVDPSSGTVFAMNQGDNTLSAITSDVQRHRDVRLPAQGPERAGLAEPGSRIQPVPERVRTDPANRLGVRGERRRRQRPVGSEPQPLHRDRHRRLPRRSSKRAGPRVPDLDDPATGTICASNSSLPQIDVFDGATSTPGTSPAAPRSRKSR